MTALHQLSQGEMYRVRYSYQAGNYRTVEREMDAKFIDQSGTTTYWSLRPLMGTQELQLDQIRSAKLLPHDAEPKLPKKPRVSS